MQLKTAGSLKAHCGRHILRDYTIIFKYFFQIEKSHQSCMTNLQCSQFPQGTVANKIQLLPVLSCPVLSCPVLSCPVLSSPVLSCPVLSCPVLSSPVLSYPVLSCPVPSCPVPSRPVLSAASPYAPVNLRMSWISVLHFCLASGIFMYN